MEFTIRPAVPEDIGFFYYLANESLVRSNSFSTDPIPWSEHVSWYERWYTHACVVQTTGGEPMGWWRVNVDREVGVALAPRYRGQGLAAKVITAGSLLAGQPLTARIKHDNTPSLRAFLGAGYRVSDVGAEYATLVYTARLPMYLESGDGVHPFQLLKDIYDADWTRQAEGML